MYLQLGKTTLSLDEPHVMGVLNVAPDSFSDGGRFDRFDDALRQAEKMLVEGASIIDIGGESTRPGAVAVLGQAEIDRVVPVVEAVSGRLDIPVSVDTSKPEVMTAAVTSGATMINDVFALRRKGALQAAAKLDVPVCLMHMQGEPSTMQDKPHYSDVTSEVSEFLSGRLEACKVAGISHQNLCVDPGFGFGKMDTHNLALLHNLASLQSLQVPVFVGLSRKRMLGSVTGKGINDRTAAGVAAAVLAVGSGANIVRTHDVGVTVDALKMVKAVREAG